jgi:glycosyltransferase involved in cell wall biosynthesis
MSKNPEAPVWSIFVPFFATQSGDAERYLKATIASVLAQTVSDWKLTVVDNCSPIDGIPELVSSFKDPRIHYVRNSTNVGQAGNWNICIGLNQSPYFTLLHADDILKPCYGQVMLNIARAQKHATLVFCAADVINESDKRIYTLIDAYKGLSQPSFDYDIHGESGLLKLIQGNFLVCPTAMYNRDLFGSLRFNEADFFSSSDYWMWTEMLLRDHVIWSTPRKLFIYRRHSLSGTAHARKGLYVLQEERRCLRNLVKASMAKSWNKAAHKAGQAKFARNRALFFATKELLQFKVKDAIEKLAFAFK